MRKEFDPVAYIENAFLDRQVEKPLPKPEGDLEVDLPDLGLYLKNGQTPGKPGATLPKKKFKRTAMSAPRPRRVKSSAPATPIDNDLQGSLEALPKMIEFLGNHYDDRVTANYYGGEFKETRNELIRRLLDPQLTLEETSRLLGVCPATVRRYTNRGWLAHQRTVGKQRRFMLSDIVRFVEEHGRLPEES